MLAQNHKRILKHCLVYVFFFTIIIYTFFHTKNLVFGVKLKINGIENGSSYTSPLLSLTGKAKNAINFTLDGRKIFINKDGDWQDQLLLSPGYNIISFEAQDKFGH